MAKMFYTLEEVCEKLGRSEDDVKEMVSTGQIQEFRDRDRLMFKVEQIDLLGAEEDTSEVHLELEDTGGGSALGLTDSGIPLVDSREATGLSDSHPGLAESHDATGLGLVEESREGTGISVFDTDHGTGDRDGAVDVGGATGDDDAESTRVGDAAFDDDLSLEAVGSGSGLLDLTRESDDTSLGAELLEEVYSGDENIEIPSERVRPVRSGRRGCRRSRRRHARGGRRGRGHRRDARHGRRGVRRLGLRPRRRPDDRRARRRS